MSLWPPSWGLLFGSSVPLRYPPRQVSWFRDPIGEPYKLAVSWEWDLMTSQLHMKGSLPHRAHWTSRPADKRGIYFGKYEMGREESRDHWVLID